MGFNISTRTGFFILWGLVWCRDWSKTLELVTSWHSLCCKAGRLWTHLYMAQDGDKSLYRECWKALTSLSDRKIGLRRTETIYLIWDPHLGMNSALSMKRSLLLYFVQILQSSWALWMLRVLHEILMWLQEKTCTYWATFFCLCGSYFGQLSNVWFSYEISVIISAGSVVQKLYCMLPDKEV